MRRVLEHDDPSRLTRRLSLKPSSSGRRSRTGRVREVNLAEQDIGELNSTDGRVEFAMQPFHIRTVALIVNDAWRENVVGLAGRLPWDHQRDAGREAVQEVS